VLALFKELVGAIPVAEIIELPGLGCRAPVTNCLLVNKHFDGPEVAGEITRICVGLGYL
jgi:hypothetical protein